MNDLLSPLPFIGRLLLALIFVLSGISKLGALAATSAHMVIPESPMPTIWCGARLRWSLAAARC